MDKVYAALIPGSLGKLHVVSLKNEDIDIKNGHFSQRFIPDTYIHRLQNQEELLNSSHSKQRKQTIKRFFDPTDKAVSLPQCSFSHNGQNNLPQIATDSNQNSGNYHRPHHNHHIFPLTGMGLIDPTSSPESPRQSSSHKTVTHRTKFGYPLNPDYHRILRNSKKGKKLEQLDHPEPSLSSKVDGVYSVHRNKQSPKSQPQLSNGSFALAYLATLNDDINGIKAESTFCSTLIEEVKKPLGVTMAGESSNIKIPSQTKKGNKEAPRKMPKGEVTFIKINKSIDNPTMSESSSTFVSMKTRISTQPSIKSREQRDGRLWTGSSGIELVTSMTQMPRVAPNTPADPHICSKSLCK